MKLVTLMTLSLLLVNCAAMRVDGLKAWKNCDPSERYVESEMRPTHSKCGDDRGARTASVRTIR